MPMTGPASVIRPFVVAVLLAAFSLKLDMATGWAVYLQVLAVIEFLIAWWQLVKLDRAPLVVAGAD